MKRALLPPLAPLAKGQEGRLPPVPPSPAFLTVLHSMEAPGYFVTKLITLEQES